MIPVPLYFENTFGSMICCSPCVFAKTPTTEACLIRPPPSTICGCQAVKNASPAYTWFLPFLAFPKICWSTLRRALNPLMFPSKQKTQISMLFGLSSSVSPKLFLDQAMLFLSLLCSADSTFCSVSFRSRIQVLGSQKHPAVISCPSIPRVTIDTSLAGFLYDL